ncbi:MAG: hypothetical protein ACRD41_00285 [Candidatus Acidiferrales bacterium]
MTLYQVSQRSAELFGRSSLYFIPQRLYRELAIGALSPNIHQLAAFSRISNYHLSDWLAVFGFRLDDIPRLQLLIPRRRTVLLDSSIYNQEQWVPWFSERISESPRNTIAPLGQFLKPGAAKRARELLGFNKKRFLYVKVGRDDVFAFPTLAAGSIARIDVGRAPDLSSALGPSGNPDMFLVENGFSLNCGYLRGIDENRVMLCSTHFPFNRVELNLGETAKVIGLVDAEIRSLPATMEPEIAESTSDMAKTILPVAPDPRDDLRKLIRTSRMRAGLSFREASTLSRWIARTLDDQMYFAAAGTLSDYENVASPLRHVQKIISLCVLYCFDFWSFLRAAGIPVDLLGSDPMSDEFSEPVSLRPIQPSSDSAGLRMVGERGDGLLSSLTEKWEELPLFLRSALPEISGLKGISLSDIFWVGRSQDPIHPALAGASLLSVNRRVKAPSQPKLLTPWDQPLYIVLLRGGSYVCGSCELRRGVLIVHPHTEGPYNSIQLKVGIDAEVIGRVTAILRRLS